MLLCLFHAIWDTTFQHVSTLLVASPRQPQLPSSLTAKSKQPPQIQLGDKPHQPLPYMLCYSKQ
jgi:hypothetical protein